ncbi:MAG TPA: helix-turn-helix domain-containing protein [Polyangiaceae bacterium]|jgi:transposase|nr:helix-turn-helix domain-containing protein [Polyangiaceae bacterium]
MHDAHVTESRRLILDAERRRELEAFVARADARPAHVRRAKVVLLAADGLRNNEIARRLSLSVGQVSRIRNRYQQASIEGLADRPRGGRKDHAVPPEKKRLVLSIAQSTPPVGRVRWTTRLIGARVGLCSATVAKVLRTARPHEGQCEAE